MTIWHRVLDFGVWLVDFNLVQSIKLISYDAYYSDKFEKFGAACLLERPILTLRPSLWSNYGNTSLCIDSISTTLYDNLILIWYSYETSVMITMTSEIPYRFLHRRHIKYFTDYNTTPSAVVGCHQESPIRFLFDRVQVWWELWPQWVSVDNSHTWIRGRWTPIDNIHNYRFDGRIRGGISFAYFFILERIS